MPHAYHKRPREYKLRAFVGVLFLVITLLVTFAHIFYYQELLKVRLQSHSLNCRNRHNLVVDGGWWMADDGCIITSYE